MHRHSNILMLAPLVIPLMVLGCGKVAETSAEVPNLTVDYTGSANREVAEPIAPMTPTEMHEAPSVHEVRTPRPTALERAETHYIEAADLQALDLERIAADRDREEEAHEAERLAERRAHPVEY